MNGPVRRWEPVEDDVLREEYAKGRKGWMKRAGARLPHRTYGAIGLRANGLILTEHAKANLGKPGPGHRLPQRAPRHVTMSATLPAEREPSRAPLADRIPDFMRDDFARWGVAV